MSALQYADTGAAAIYDSLSKMLQLAVSPQTAFIPDQERAHLQEEYSSHQETIQAISLGTNHQGSPHRPQCRVGTAGF